jgi:hypothetical protein
VHVVLLRSARSLQSSPQAPPRCRSEPAVGPLWAWCGLCLLCSDGFEEDAMRAAVNSLEFSLREFNTGWRSPYALSFAARNRHCALNRLCSQPALRPQPALWPQPALRP